MFYNIIKYWKWVLFRGTRSKGNFCTIARVLKVEEEIEEVVTETGGEDVTEIVDVTEEIEEKEEIVINSYKLL